MIGDRMSAATTGDCSAGMASLSGKDSTKQHVSRFGACGGSSEVSCSKVGGGGVCCSKKCNLSRAQSTVADAKMSGQTQSDVTAASGVEVRAAQGRQYTTPHQGHRGPTRWVRSPGDDRRCYTCGDIGHISSSCQRSRDGRRGNTVGHRDARYSRQGDVNYSPSRYVNYSPSGRLKGPAVKCTPIWPRAKSWCNCTN